MNYPNYYNPYLNNFVNQTPQMPSQVQPTNSNLVGKVVDSLEMVRGADIPMDGQAYYFPKADGSMVYSKRWLPNCTTQIMAYAPQVENVQANISEGQEQANLDITDLSQRITSIEDKLDLLLGRINNESKRTVKSNTTKQSNDE